MVDLNEVFTAFNVLRATSIKVLEAAQTSKNSKYIRGIDMILEVRADGYIAVSNPRNGWLYVNWTHPLSAVAEIHNANGKFTHLLELLQQDKAPDMVWNTQAQQRLPDYRTDPVSVYRHAIHAGERSYIPRTWAESGY